MAVAVIERPLGHKLDTTAISASVSDDSGDALFTSFAHGLSDEYVYIESNIDSYNGFWYVQSGFGVDSFKLLPNEDSMDFVQFKQVADVLYYESELDHGWQCAHLPIMYELENDLYPTNSVDTVISVGAYGFVNGYFALTHAALTGADELFALDYVMLDNGSIIQVVEIVSSTITVLNYDGAYVGSTMQKVRNNYHVLVNVYAGLPVGHPWETEKPYELATTLRFIPDSNNRIKFSISEILKGYITTRNNLTLDTLPNNIDFMTAFYIEFTEAYDVSDGTGVTVFESEFEEDTFEGYAVNAMLPFKNLYSGFMSEYIDTTNTGELSKWLTTMDVPIIFVGYFFDLSFINTHTGDIKINKNGVLYLTITNPGIGVLRVPIEAEAGDTELCIQAFQSLLTVYNLSSFTDGIDWTTGAAPSVTLAPLVTSSELTLNTALPAGSYMFFWNITVTGVDGIFSVKFKKAGVTISNFAFDTVTPGINIDNKAITLTDDADELVFQITNAGGGGDSTYVINALSLTGELYITESICLRVVSECDTFIADDLRLIETGPFRELE